MLKARRPAESDKLRRSAMIHPAPLYSVTGVVHRLWRSGWEFSATELVNNSARRVNLDSGPVTNKPLDCVLTRTPQALAQGRSLSKKDTHPQVRTPHVSPYTTCGLLPVLPTPQP
jgi:hypothetical protein